MLADRGLDLSHSISTSINVDVQDPERKGVIPLA